MTVFNDMLDYLLDGANWSGDKGMLALLLQQLLLTATALLIALGLGLPVALWLGHLGRGGFLAINVSNIGRAVPTFALLGLFVIADPWGWTNGWFPGTATVGPYGRAGGATLVALALFALPPIITNAYVAMREVPEDVKEAATGMGMSGWQRFVRVELPLSTPVLMSGVRLALVQVWATATIAALVAGPGLGRIITDGFFRTNYGKGLAGAVVVALVALVLEAIGAVLQRLVDPVPRTDRRGSARDGSPSPSPDRATPVSADAPRVSGAESFGD